MFAIVNGSVEKTFYEGKGLKIKESFTRRDGQPGAAYYTAFFETPHGLNVGDTAKFSGLLSAKARDYEKQDGSVAWIADITLNNAKAEDVTSANDADSPF